VTVRFEARTSPTLDQIAAIARVGPPTPFSTPAYAAARAAIGDTPCVLGLHDGADIVSGCMGFLRGGRLSRLLEITTVPFVTQPGFWDGVRSFCQQQGVWELWVESFGAPVAEIPRLPGELSRRPRYEFVLDLAAPDPLARVSKHHRRNIARATRAGFRVGRTSEPSAARSHLRLIQASMERRQHRGENVSAPGDIPFFEALLRSGAAELFQAAQREGVVSSVMVLRSRETAYYQSAGTVPEGMRAGASPFLISEVARTLRQEGVQTFNLGGASPEIAGLGQFKAGFGAQVVSLEAASFSMVAPITRRLRTVARLVRLGTTALFPARQRESSSMWAALLRRVFALDVFQCPRCGGRRRLVGVPTGGERLQALLERLGLVSASPSAESRRARRRDGERNRTRHSFSAFPRPDGSGPRALVCLPVRSGSCRARRLLHDGGASSYQLVTDPALRRRRA
jgi:hypothetical protein